MRDGPGGAAARSGWRRGVLAALSLLASPASAAQPEIRIGEVASYSALPTLAEPYRKGWQMAVDEVNLAGGIDGRTLVVLSRDDAGRPDNAGAAAEALIGRDHVALLVGGLLSSVGLALADVARRHRTVYLAGEPPGDAIVWSAGNRYTFRLRPSTTMQAAMLAEAAAKLPARTWAAVAPRSDDGQAAVAAFKARLAARRPDVTWVADQVTAPGRIDAPAVAAAVGQARPDAILNAESGPDLLKLLRAGAGQDLFADRRVVSFLTGESEDLDALKDEAPEGWIVTGYPAAALRTPENDAFVRAYQARYNEAPRMGSVLGYALIKAAAEILRRAGGPGSDRLVAAAEGLAFDTPLGRAQFRTLDHQSTLGTFVGRTAQRNNHGVMVDFGYRDGARYLPADAEVRAMRPAD